MAQDTQIVLPFASLSGKHLQADFDGGTLSSDGGVLFLREIEAHVGVIRRLAGALRDPRDSRYTDHSCEEMLRPRIFQIACGYDDANDCTPLRHDPAFKGACGRLPISDAPLASQPSMSRFENAPSRRDLYRTAQALFDTFVASYDRVPQSVLLDIDDMADEVHGRVCKLELAGYIRRYETKRTYPHAMETAPTAAAASTTENGSTGFAPSTPPQRHLVDSTYRCPLA